MSAAGLGSTPKDVAAATSGIGDLNLGGDSLELARFHDFLLKRGIQRAIEQLEFTVPSEVEFRCIPMGILGSDMLIVARPGSGKTTTMTVSALEQLRPTERVTSMVVVCDSARAVEETRKAFTALGCFMDLTVHACRNTTGALLFEDIQRVTPTIPHVMIGVAPSLRELVKAGALKLGGVRHLLVHGCEAIFTDTPTREDFAAIHKLCSEQKQTIMIDSTISEAVKNAVLPFMQNPFELILHTDDPRPPPPPETSIKHYVYHTAEGNKRANLNDLLDALPFEQVIIFSRSVQRAEAVRTQLKEDHFPCELIHDDTPPAERERVWDNMRNYNARILSATDTVCIDDESMGIRRLNAVIHYDTAYSVRSYLNRTRRGAQERPILSVTFAAGEEDAALMRLVQTQGNTLVNEAVALRFEHVMNSIMM